MFDASGAVIELSSSYREQTYVGRPERFEANVASTSAGTSTGKWADIIAATADNSGARYRVLVRTKSRIQVELLELIESWIDEYGNNADEDFDLQVKELEQNKLRFEQP
jgi:hypothetical protein